MSIEAALAQLPELLQSRAQHHWDNLAEKEVSAQIEQAGLAHEVMQVLACSDFIAQSLTRYPPLITELLEGGSLHRCYQAGEMAQRLESQLDGVVDEAQLSEQLRRFRRREMVRIAWRDLAGHANLNEVTEDLSALADACVDQALSRLYKWHSEQWGTPMDPEGNPQQLVVIGMGKLGARELNFSSDIDLIFSYPEDGETQGGRKTLVNQEFFVRLGQRLIAALDQGTAHGFVFRVDMRLRPFGASSALAISFDAMEDYYQVHGREWERYALIKARVIAGDQERGEELMDRLRPFVYRKYVDYGAFESLREMKAMIAREVARKGMENNIKLGAGGIREVEFIGQAFQLIRGGREKTLQQRRILTILEALRGFEMLPDYVVEQLTDAYIFLRDSEHRLQAFADQQTHMLPSDDQGRQRLAFSMGFESWEAYEQSLRLHMQHVHEHFEQVFAAPQTDHADSDELDLTGVWQGNLDDDQAHTALKRAGFSEPEEAYRRVKAVREGRQFLALSSTGRTRMNHLMPLLLGAMGQSSHPDRTMVRLLDLIERIARRSAYLALLVENPMALSQLVRLCDASPWIAHALTQMPQLLDELLDPRQLYSPLKRDALNNELRTRLRLGRNQDLEEQMDVLRRFKQANVLRVAAADVMEAVPLMVVSDHLTEIAEVCLEGSLDVAWHHLIERHGRPQCGDDRVCDTGFAVIGYGKMGGIELGYGSDLDIVFLHSADSAGRSTDGDKPLDNAVFYARLAQRLIHVLSTRTPAGTLYEADTRLRPDGASGLLVSNVDAYADYQRNQAWTWEHQALVRARFIAGDQGIAEAFEKVRSEILCQPRDKSKLSVDVREMREKMRAHLSKAKQGQFDIKQDPGGIADIEFMVQYGVLARAHRHPSLIRYTDNIRILEGFAECGLMSQGDVALLCDAYRAYRAAVHRLTLQEQPALVDTEQFDDYRQRVLALWRQWMHVE